MTIDVLLFDRIGHAEGAAFTRKTMHERGVGGSEIEMIQVAHALAERGHKVALANGRRDVVEEDGVLYVPNADVDKFSPTKALYLQRMSMPARPLRVGADVRIIVRANDLYCAPYDVHRDALISGRAALVANTKWQADGFKYAKEKIVIAPMLDESPKAFWAPAVADSGGVYKMPGLFVYASGPMKGLDATLAMWRKLHKQYGKVLKKAKLVIISPGWGEFPTLSPSDKAIGVRFEGVPTPDKYREWIAKAEGLFFVNTMAECFCCSAALAERSGTRTHILCKNGLGGIPEAIVNHSLLTEDETQFIEKFMEAWQSSEKREQWYAKSVPDRRPSALIEQWIDALKLTRGAVQVPVPLDPADARVSNILGELRSRLVALGKDPTVSATATDYWRGRAKTLTKLAETAPIEKFLSWTNDLDHEEMADFHDWYKALRSDPAWDTRWKRLSRKMSWGEPHPFSLDDGTTPVAFVHAYHLMRYEAAAKARLLDDVDVVFELGGGYGNFCRMLRADGFKGPHIIVDLPHVREFQRAYLQLCGVPVTTEPALTDGAVLLIEKDIEQAVEMCKGKRVAFIATWSLSETPLALRAKLFPALHKHCTKYVIATQWPHHTPEPGVSNETYFTSFMKESGRKFVIGELPGRYAAYGRYLFGVVATPKAGTHLGHYVNTLLPEHIQKGQWGSAQRYWVHDRILVGGSIIDEVDANKLRALGITHVLSAESERDDEDKWSKDASARFAWPDSGTEIADSVLHKAMDFVEAALSEPTTVLYAHCQMGGSRGPTLGYLALRSVFGYRPSDAMRAVCTGWAGDNRQPNPTWTPHLKYIQSIERALDTRPAKDGSRLVLKDGESTPLIDSRVLDAYRVTKKFSYVAEQIVDKESLYEIFRQNIAKLGAVDDATASGTWRSRCAAISERATRNMDDFLSWTEDLYITGLPRNEIVAIDALRRSPQWADRWSRLTRKSAFGGARSSSLDGGATAVTIQHAHHLLNFEQMTGRKVTDCDVVVEIGGGFGNFARTLREDGFRGTHVIIDLPHVREFARLFLSLHGTRVTDKPELIDGVCLLTTDDIEAAIEMVSGRRVAFVATWSLSEAPMAVRDRLFPALHKDCVAYLIASQWDHQWESIDNRDYFASFMQASGARWQTQPVPGDPEERYLFGVRGVEYTPGASLMQKLEKAVREKLGEDLAGFEQLLTEDRVSFKKNELQIYPSRIPPRTDGRPTVGLLLICKGDEGATIIARAIVSAMKIVDTVTVVADGGPKTIEVCHALGADVIIRKTPEMNWETGVGYFAGARNEALTIAERKTDYVLFLDPDDYYEGELPSTLDKDLYEVFVHDSNLRYPRAQLLKSSRSFRYTGIIHETIVAQNATIGRLESLKYIRSHGGHQDRNPPTVKYAQHARWLERWLIEHPDDSRAQFYLAQSYRDSQQYDKAIAAYEKRIEMPVFDEERAFSAVQIARTLRDTGKDPTIAYLRGYEMRPTRAEPLCELARWLRDEKQKRFALAVLVAKQAAALPFPVSDYLFLEPSVYEWVAREELAIALYWSGNKAGSRDCYSDLLGRVPDWHRAHIQAMLAMVVREVG